MCKSSWHVTIWRYTSCRSKCSRSPCIQFDGCKCSSILTFQEIVNFQKGKSNGIIPLLAKGTTYHPHGEYGTIRKQVNARSLIFLISWFQTADVKYKDGWKPGMEKDSHGFISRQFIANSKEKAGSNLLDRRRTIVSSLELQK